jgi:hypothetical protein
MTILNFEEFSKNDFIVENLENTQINNGVDEMVAEISKIVKKNIDVKLSVLIEPYFDSKLKSESDRQRFVDIVYKAYIQEYLNVLKEYGDYYVEGKGKKTNGYGTSGQNFAYNYINHIDFERSATERPKYDSNDRGVGTIHRYKYFENVWSIACRRVVERYKYKFNLKLDHKEKNNKNNDFNGRLVVFNINDNSFWKSLNLPKNQRYN